MSSTYSSSLRIELIGTGDQAGTWGATTNINLGTLLEAGVCGYTSVSVGSANQALTAIDGAPDEARNAVLALTTSTGANFAIYAPPVEKTYVIYNASSYTATIYNSTVLGNTTAAGAGVSIPAGKTMAVWSDGTNFAVQMDYAAALTLGAPLGVASGGTGVTTSTGTGSAVLSASPTFTGTPAAPTASYGTNTTQLATTAFVQAALQALYPVGSIYINAAVSTNPATLFGFGTWVAFGAGKVVVGLDAGDSAFDTLEETGGNKDAIVVSHTHTGTTSTNGDHSHTSALSGYPSFDFTSNNLTGVIPSGSYNTSTAGAHNHTFTTDSSGASGTNANLQPYIVVQMWKRTA